MATCLNGVWVQNEAFAKVLSTNWLFQAVGHPFLSGPRRLNRQNRTIFRDFTAFSVIPSKWRHARDVLHARDVTREAVATLLRNPGILWLLVTSTALNSAAWAGRENDERKEWMSWSQIDV